MLIIFHLLGVAVLLGSTLLLTLQLYTVGNKAPDAVARRERYVSLFRVYSPLTIAALLVIVMTGAWSLTPYKEALGAGYFPAVGAVLAPKLAVSFVLIIVATYACFGLCYRLVRSDQGALPVTQVGLRRMISRLRITLWLTLALTLWAAWLGLRLAPPAV